VANQELANAQKDLERRRQAAKVETFAQKRTQLMSAPLSADKPGFVIRNTKLSEAQEEQLKQEFAELDKRAAAIAAGELLIKLHKLAERRRRAAQRGPVLPKTVTAYPTLLNAAATANQAPEMRVYLLARALDPGGRGSVDLADIRRLFTGKRSKWRIYKSWRGLREVLAQGDGIFWTRENGRLWLHTPARIARALDCGRLRGLPVAMTVRPLLKSIGTVRAHFFASYESGRRNTDRPISQAGLAAITGVPDRTQRAYNKRLKRKVRKNNVVTGQSYSTANIQELAYKHGRPVFRFVDWLGKRGPKKARYCAYRIADTRSCSHKQAAKGRLKKINRQIDLVNYLERGNNRKVDRTYHPDADSAAKAFNRDPEIDRVYPDSGGLQPKASRRSKREGVRFWGEISA